MDKKRILLLSEYFYPFDHGGTEWSVYHLAKGLVSKGCRIEIMTPNYGSKSREIYDSINIYRFPFYKHSNRNQKLLTPFYFTNLLWFFLTFYCLIKEVKNFKPTHIHVQGKYFLPSAVIIGKILKIPVIVTLRDFIILCPYGICLNEANRYRACSLDNLLKQDLPVYLERYKSGANLFTKLINTFSGIYGYIISKFLRFFLKKADYIIGISNKVKLIYELNGIKVNQVIYNTIQSSRDVKSDSSDYLLYIGRLTYGKGINLLIQSYEKLNNEMDLPKLMIIGNGPQKNIIQSKFINNIELLGQKSYKDTQYILIKARLVLVPSIWEEPFGRVALESLFGMVPVVATDRGALPEIIENNITGIITKPTLESFSEGIKIALKKEKNLKANLQRKQKELIEKFITHPLKQHIDIYQKL